MSIDELPLVDAAVYAGVGMKLAVSLLRGAVARIQRPHGCGRR